MLKRSHWNASLVLGVVGCVLSGAAFEPTAKPDAKRPDPTQRAEPKKGEPEKTQPAKAEPKAEKPAPTLVVGSIAPSISVDKWVKGEEVKSIESGKVYVVEFWGTWCPPCRKSIPHLTEVQKENPSVTIIGVTSSERKEKDGTDKRVENLEKFVKAQGKQMDYRVAYDSDRQMWDAWMEPAGRNGIPSAFIVGHEGKITWIGNPNNEAFEGEVKKAADAAKQASSANAPS